MVTTPKTFPPMSIEILTGHILGKIPEIGKWQQKFMNHLFHLLFVVRGRHNFENLSRYGERNEVSYREWYGRDFDFLRFNTELLKSLGDEDRVVAFDPSYLSKSGKHTDGVGHFWSGCAGCAKYGLEIAGFASVGLESRTAMHLYAVQTIGQEKHKTLLEYYSSLVAKHGAELRKISNTIVADAYFSRSGFVNAVLEQEMDLVSKLRSDAVLKYDFLGEPTKKRGRPRKYEGKVDKKNPDLRHFKIFYQDSNTTLYEGVVHAHAFKMQIKCVIAHTVRKNGKIGVEVFFSTDTKMKGERLIDIYRLRFHIEFLYRDAKQHMGLNHCQARAKEKIHMHVNASLTAVSLAKACHYLNVPKSERKPFSLSSIKTQYFNEHLLNRFFVKFGIDPETHKKTEQYNELYKYGCIAA